MYKSRDPPCKDLAEAEVGGQGGGIMVAALGASLVGAMVVVLVVVVEVVDVVVMRLRTIDCPRRTSCILRVPPW